MAQNHIAIDQTKVPFGSDFAMTLRLLQQGYAKLTFLKSKMDQMIVSADYTMLEAQFGLAAGKGVLTYNLVSGALPHFTAAAPLNDANLRDLLSWDGVPA